MTLYFSTVIRSAPPERGGQLVRLDWNDKVTTVIMPVQPAHQGIEDPNPRGNTRGGRGIALVGTDVLVIV